jgi:hypothetical protein
MKKASIAAAVVIVLLLVVVRVFFYAPCDATWRGGSTRCDCAGFKIDVTDRASAAVDSAPGGETRCLGVATAR